MGNVGHLTTMIISDTLEAEIIQVPSADGRKCSMEKSSLLCDAVFIALGRLLIASGSHPGETRNKKHWKSRGLGA